MCVPMAWATGGLDRVGMRHAHHHTSLWAARQPIDGRDHPDLHLGEALATGEPECGRGTKHRVPLGQLHQLLQLGAGPIAEIALQQSLVDAHLQARGPWRLARRSRGRARAATNRRRRHGPSAAMRSAAALACCSPASARCRPGARPGRILPVVGVKPWRTNRNNVDDGGACLWSRHLDVAT